MSTRASKLSKRTCAIKFCLNSQKLQSNIYKLMPKVYRNYPTANLSLHSDTTNQMNSRINQTNTSRPTQQTLFLQATLRTFTKKCAFCSSFFHKSENCQKISSVDKKSRQEKLKQSEACFLCLKVGKHVA